MYNIPHKIVVDKRSDGYWYAELLTSPTDDQQWAKGTVVRGADYYTTVSRLKYIFRHRLANQWEASCKVIDRPKEGRTADAKLGW